MPKTKQQKAETLKDLEQELKQAKSATLVSFAGLPIKSDIELRNKLFENNISYQVVKKTLLQKAFASLGLATADIENHKNNISIAVSVEDEVAPAKIINDFAKRNEALKIFGGILESKWIDEIMVKNLASLPSKDEMLARTVYTIQAPISGFVNVLAGNLRGLVNVLNSLKDKRSL
jgi:large subunit ribosomal protein L10